MMMSSTWCGALCLWSFSSHPRYPEYHGFSFDNNKQPTHILLERTRVINIVFVGTFFLLLPFPFQTASNGTMNAQQQTQQSSVDLVDSSLRERCYSVGMTLRHSFPECWSAKADFLVNECMKDYFESAVNVALR